MNTNSPPPPAEGRRFMLLDHPVPEVAEQIRALLFAAYTVEARLIGAADFPLLVDLARVRDAQPRGRTSLKLGTFTDS